jgi:hypothetical protein
MIDWVKYLLPSGAARDKTIFTIWASGRISTGEAIKRFKLSNNMPYYVNIEPDEFICWMKSLGYRRNKNG